MAKVTTNLGFWAYFCTTISPAGIPVPVGEGGRRRLLSKDSLLINVRGPELLSKEWCKLVFEGRNKQYGAYKLRRDAGKRYARAICIVTAGVFALFVLPLLFGLFIRYTIREHMDEIASFARLKPLEIKKDTTLKAVSAGRRAVPMMKPGASTAVPEIVDGLVAPKPLGIDGPVSFEEDEKAFVMADADTDHNVDKTDLPVEGIQLTPTEVVEQMPEFPGGLGELMKWLDRHVIYPKSCVDAKVEGDMEVTFLVDENGKVTEPAVSKSLHPDLDKAALMAMNRMPQWKPGRSGGRITIVRITLPIHFQLK